MNGVEPIALCSNEVIQLTSIMRKNARWAQGGVASILGGSQDDSLAGRWGLRSHKASKTSENPLMSGFSKLRLELQDCNDFETFDTPSLLHPFLQVVRSSSTSGPITSIALQSIHKFFAYKIIHSGSPRLGVAVHMLCSAVAHCRFESSDSAQDEVVLLRILRLMEVIMTGVAGGLLTDESVCEMMETALSMCCQTRLSEMLRRSAEISMVSMCQVIFTRLSTLPVTESRTDYKMEPEVSGRSSRRNSIEKEESIRPENGEEMELIPYSVGSVRELLRVLVSLLDSNARQYTDSMRVMAIRILDVAFETAGRSIAILPALLQIVTDDLSRSLFQLMRSDAPILLTSSLRLTATLLQTVRPHLKLQQELFFSYLVTCLKPPGQIPHEQGIDPVLYESIPNAPRITLMSSGRSTPVPVKEQKRLMPESGTRSPDSRESMVECIGGLVRIPSFMVELFVNYDCEVDRTDLCEDVIGFLARNSFPDAATWSTPNVPPLCLDALLAYVEFIAERLDIPVKTDGLPAVEELMQKRARKQLMIKGASKFNENPRLGIEYFAAHEIIDADKSPPSVAKMLRGTSRINKSVLGKFLAKHENKPIMDAFIESFDFNGKRMDEALRSMLVSFRLPGESQQIERLLGKFSERYQETNPSQVANADAGYLLAYSIIMLNVDQHKPNLKRRMTLDDYTRNLRGGNDDKNFDSEYLQQVFQAISSNEIIMPEEHDSQASFEYAWKELLQKSENAGQLIVCDTNLYDAAMFAATWKPLIAALTYVFMSATDDAVFSRVVSGFDHCARIATKSQLSEAMDRIILCLSKISGIPEEPFSTLYNAKVQVEGNEITVSEMSVKFGQDFKSQLATVVLFRMCKDNEAIIDSGWTKIIQTWSSLYVNSLTSSPFPQLLDELGLDPIPTAAASSAIIAPQQSNASLFTTLSSYLTSYAADEPPEPSEQEIDSTMCTLDCIQSCRLPEIFENLHRLDADKCQLLMRSLLRYLGDNTRSSTTIIVTKRPERPSTPQLNGGASVEPVYDPAFVYVLEFATGLACQKKQFANIYADVMMRLIGEILSDVKDLHQITTFRSIHYLILLLKSSSDGGVDETKVTMTLQILSSIDIETLRRCSVAFAKGMLSCVKSSRELKERLSLSKDFWMIFHELCQGDNPDASLFELLEDLACDAVLCDMNILHLVAMLDSFAEAASIGAPYEQRQDGAAKHGKPLKPNPNSSVVARGVRAVVLIFGLQASVETLVREQEVKAAQSNALFVMSLTIAWKVYWTPFFTALSHQCLNPCREVRLKAFNSLQRALLSEHLVSADTAPQWDFIFDGTVLSLTSQLLKPEVFQTDPRGMIQTRGHAATLLGKVFLHYLGDLAQWSEMRDLWLKILDVMDRLMHSGQRETISESVGESLKNVILVMSTSGYLVPPEEGKDDLGLWNVTWEKLDRVLPDLKEQLFPRRVEEERRLSQSSSG